MALAGGIITAAAGTTTTVVAGTDYLYGSACPSSTSCEAVGESYNSDEQTDQAVAVAINSGVPATTQTVSGDYAALFSVACSSATVCEGVGEDLERDIGIVVTITDGTPGSEQLIPASGYLIDVSCSSATVCQAVGQNTEGNEGVVVPITSGSAGSVESVSGTEYLTGVNCADSSTCFAVGGTSADTGVVVPISSGVPGTGVTDSAISAFTSVSCPTATACIGVAQNYDGDEGVVVPITSGDPGSAQAASGTGYLNYVACLSMTSCEAVGLNPSLDEGVVVPVIGGVPIPTQPISGTFALEGVACESDTTCYAVGGSASPDSSTGLIVQVMSPSAPSQPVTLAEPSAVSLSWSAPSNAGSSAVNSYQVTPYVGATAETPINTGSDATSYTATGLTDGQAYTFTMAAVSAFGEGPASLASSAVTPAAPAAATYNPVTPYRICDTRSGNPSGLSGTNAQCNGQALGPAGVITIQVSGTNPSGTASGGVPSSATSVILNVTVTDTTLPSYLTVWPAGGARPLSSSVNWSNGQTVPNAVTVGLSSTGQISLFNANGDADVVVDVEGWMDSTDTDGDPYLPLTPYRICDTRAGNPSDLAGTNAQCDGKTLHAASTLTIQAAGTNPSGTVSGGIPNSGVLAVDLTVTVTDTQQPSYLTVWPAGVSQPLASNLNFVGGQTVANNVVVAVPASGPDAGMVSIFNANGNTDVIVDVSGYFGTTSGGADFTPMVPYRICDTRATSISGLDDVCTGDPLEAGVPLALQVAGVGGIPMGATSVVINVTVTDTTAPDYLTTYPDGTTRPFVSNLNWLPGETVASGVTATLGADGAIDFYIPNGQADLVVDVVGWDSA